MKTQIKLFYMLFLSALLLLSSCEGPQGEIGPQGAKGDIGASGATMYSSDWITPSWSYNSTFKYWFTSIDSPKITKEIIDKGHVEVYYKFSASDVRNLPFFDVNTSNNNSIVNMITHNLNIGKIVMSSSLNPSGTFRYIIIPPSAGARKILIDYSNYEVVKKYYNLPD